MRLNNLYEKLSERMLLEISFKIKVIRCGHQWIGCEGMGKQPRNDSKFRA
jgi:hypothetical protein